MNPRSGSRAVALALVLVSGCVAYKVQKRTLSYDTAGAPLLTGGPLSSYALVVRPPIDERPVRSVVQRPPDGPYKVRQGYQEWYATSDDGFHLSRTVEYAVGDAIAGHLSVTQLFKRAQVSDADPPPGELVLTSKLTEFVGLREDRDSSEAFVGMYGLIGLVLLATQDADLVGHTTLSDVRLTDASTGSVLWQGAVDGAIKEEVALNPGLAEAQAFDAANRSLRLAVDDLVRKLASVQPTTGGGGAVP